METITNLDIQLAKFYTVACGKIFASIDGLSISRRNDGCRSTRVKGTKKSFLRIRRRRKRRAEAEAGSCKEMKIVTIRPSPLFQIWFLVQSGVRWHYLAIYGLAQAQFLPRNTNAIAIYLHLMYIQGLQVENREHKSASSLALLIGTSRRMNLINLGQVSENENIFPRRKNEQRERERKKIVFTLSLFSYLSSPPL